MPQGKHHAESRISPHHSDHAAKAALAGDDAIGKSEEDMQKRNALIIAAILVTGGCSVPMIDDAGAPNSVGNVPEAVVTLAAPGQDLTTARLLPDDDCYWYEHSGPVETTLVPLRSTGGNPICASRPS